MNAVVITIGAEILAGDIVDTNFHEIARSLRGVGVSVSSHLSVDDDVEIIAGAVRAAAGEADVVVVTGGLGPTPDDRTRFGVAEAFGLELILHEDLIEAMRARILAYGGRVMPEINRVQVQFPRGAEPLLNPVGTAPGFRLEHDRAVIFVMPGIPREMRRMLQEQVVPWLEAHRSTRTLVSRTLKTVGIGESQLVERFRPALESVRDVDVAYYPQMPGVHLRLRAEGTTREEARARIDAAEAVLRHEMGTIIFGADDETLSGVVGGLLIDRGWTVATAESCTGGGIAAYLVAEPGASRYVDRGVVAYSNRAKMELLGVPESLLREHGAVSEPVARAMAEGLRERAGTDAVIAVTGIAGPDGGTSDKPVGLVHSAIAVPGETRAWRATYPGSRALVIRRTIVTQVDRLRRMLLEAS